MMERHYRPDGWLGMIVGSKLWIEFVERHMIDSSTTKLTKELGRRGMLGGSIIKDVTKGERNTSTLTAMEKHVTK